MYGTISEIAPDVIVFHGISAGDARCEICRDNPSVRLYADNHSDWLTVGRTWFTKWFLHYVLSDDSQMCFEVL